MKISRKRTKVLLVLAFLALLLGLGVAVCLMDDPPPEDADLRITREAIPDEENAFTCFVEAGNAVVWPHDANILPGSTDCPEDRLLHDDVAWDDALAQKTLEANRRALDLWDQGLARPRLQVPEITRMEESMPYTLGWLALVGPISLRSRYLAQTGHAKEAYEEAIKLVTFGHRLQGADSCLFTWAVGTFAKMTGLKRLHLLAAEVPLPPERLRAYGDRLASLGTNTTDMADALRMEYRMFCNAVDDLSTGATSGPGTPSSDLYQFLRNDWLDIAIHSPYHLKPNRTKAIAAAYYRSLIEQTSKTALEAQSHLRRLRLDLDRRRAHLSSTVRLFTPNSAGEGIFLGVLSLAPTKDHYRHYDNTDIAATRLVLALRAFEAKNGHLPETLDELVPDFIDAVPLDDFDGKPLRWSKERKILYSVGNNLVDDGGDDERDLLGDPKDPVFRLDPRDIPQPEEEEAEEGSAAETPPETPAEKPVETSPATAP